ncbi:MAG: methylmalonyl-CoA epimerase [Zetaproteobacteria bacterium]|nr:MAG: methylmalonyl-CoA epimerase [Zetaproteobacteria bacterium]
MFAGVNHVAVVVRNVGDALRFYHEVLGLPVGHRATVPDQGVHAVLLPVGEDEIELLEPTNPSGGVARFLEKKGEGIHHLCVETPDVAAALARIKAADLPVIDQAPRKGLAGTIAFLHPAACQGILVELAQPGEAHHTPPVPASNGIRATGIATFFLGTMDVAGSAAMLEKHFDAVLQAQTTDGRLSAGSLVAAIGGSRITLLDSADLAVSPEVSRFLGGRTEGLLGLCLAVADFDGALRHLGRQGISVEVRKGGQDLPLGKVAPEVTHGVGLFLSPSR